MAHLLPKFQELHDHVWGNPDRLIESMTYQTLPGGPDRTYSFLNTSHPKAQPIFEDLCRPMISQNIIIREDYKVAYDYVLEAHERSASGAASEAGVALFGQPGIGIYIVTVTVDIPLVLLTCPSTATQGSLLSCSMPWSACFLPGPTSRSKLTIMDIGYSRRRALNGLSATHLLSNSYPGLAHLIQKALNL